MQVFTVDATRHLPTQPADVARVVERIHALDARVSACGSESEITTVPLLPSPLATIALASPPSTQTSALDVKLHAVTPGVCLPSPLRPHSDPSDKTSTTARRARP